MGGGIKGEGGGLSNVVDNDNVAQVLEAGADRLDGLPDRSMNEHNAGAAIVEHVDVIIGTQHGVDREGDRAHLNHAKEGGGKLWRIEQKQGYALLHVNAKIKQAIANTVSKLGNLRIRIGLAFRVDSDCPASPFGDMPV